MYSIWGWLRSYKSFLPLLPKFPHLSWIHGELPFVNWDWWPHSTHNHTRATLVANQHGGWHLHCLSYEGRLHKCKVCKCVVAKQRCVHKQLANP